MRFGKKLALQVMDDHSGAPYLSHKPMKEAINRTVRELRLYQAKCQGSEAVWRDGGLQSGGGAAGAAAASSPAELAELEVRVSALDRQLFDLVDEDLARILAHVRAGEARLLARVAAVQSAAADAGLLVEEDRLRRLERALPRAPEDRAALCRELLGLRARGEPLGLARRLQGLSAQYSGLVDAADQHAQYVEINVAGFRKLLKRHEKQIPMKFRSRHMPCLDFHRLVTRTSRQLLEATKQVGDVIGDAWQQLSAAVAAGAPGRVQAGAEVVGQAARICSQRPQLSEPRGLGPECEMVLHIQRQLKEPMSGRILQLTASLSGPSPGFLYPKPALPGRGGGVGGGGGQQQQQQQQRRSGGHDGLQPDAEWYVGAATDGDVCAAVDAWRGC